MKRPAKQVKRPKSTNRRDSSIRPLRLEYIEAGSLRGKINPRNWRKHPESQSTAMKSVLDKLGWAGALTYNEQTGRLVNGHMRLAAVEDDVAVPVLIGSWSEAQEKQILLTFDAITSMAEADDAQLHLLQMEVDLGAMGLGEVDAHLSSMIGESQGETTLKEIPVLAAPALTWVLIGIPTVRFGEINADVERIAKMDGVTCELSVGSGERSPESS